MLFPGDTLTLRFDDGAVASIAVTHDNAPLLYEGSLMPADTNHDDLTDNEILNAAMLLGFEWKPILNYVIDPGQLSEEQSIKFAEFGFYNSPYGNLLALNRLTAARAFLKDHLTKKP